MSTRVHESCIISHPLEHVWEAIRSLQMKFLTDVVSVELEPKYESSQVGAIRKVTYKDKAVQSIKLTELSDDRTTLSYDMIDSTPSLPFLSVSHTIRCRRVTMSSETYIEFISDFSHDAKIDVTQDSKYKKHEYFVSLEKYLKNKKEQKKEEKEEKDEIGTDGERKEKVKKKKWMPLESNPSLMNKYVSKLGVDLSLYEFVDVFGVEDDLLSMVPQPVLAVMMLFPVSDPSEKHRKEEEEKIAKNGQKLSSAVYYTHQTVGNACGTVGLIHAIANNRDKLEFAKDSFFTKFLKHTANMTPGQRAQALEEDDAIEEEHQTLASDPEAKSDVNNDFNDNLHFNCFVCVDNALYELDGRKKRAINHGPSSPSTLLQDAIKVVKQFIARDPKEVRWNLTALASKSFD